MEAISISLEVKKILFIRHLEETVFKRSACWLLIKIKKLFVDGSSNVFSSALAELSLINSTSSMTINLGFFEREELEILDFKFLISSILIFLFSSALIKTTSWFVWFKGSL